MTFNKIIVYVGSLAFVTVLGFAVAFSLSPHQASASALSTLAGRNLTIGDTGSDVADLQGILGEQGYLTMPVGVPFGYFGPLTRDALARYQAANGVSPAVGYYGPITRAKMVEIFSAHGWMALLSAAER